MRTRLTLEDLDNHLFMECGIFKTYSKISEIVCETKLLENTSKTLSLFCSVSAFKTFLEQPRQNRSPASRTEVTPYDERNNFANLKLTLEDTTVLLSKEKEDSFNSENESNFFFMNQNRAKLLHTAITTGVKSDLLELDKNILRLAFIFESNNGDNKIIEELLGAYETENDVVSINLEKIKNAFTSKDEIQSKIYSYFKNPKNSFNNDLIEKDKDMMPASLFSAWFINIFLCLIFYPLLYKFNDNITRFFNKHNITISPFVQIMLVFCFTCCIGIFIFQKRVVLPPFVPKEKPYLLNSEGRKEAQNFVNNL